jgi:hypothetical protein
MAYLQISPQNFLLQGKWTYWILSIKNRRAARTSHVICLLGWITAQKYRTYIRYTRILYLEILFLTKVTLPWS